MARARNIKPGFAKNEDLAECSIAARLCFALLPTIADKEGRLEDRPKRIKGELFPFDSFEVAPLLDELEQCDLIARYRVDGVALIQILAFRKHQNPHHREPESTLPPHPGLRLDPDGKYVHEAKAEALGSLQPPKAEAQGALHEADSEARPGFDPPRSDFARGSSRVDSGYSDSRALNPDQALSKTSPPLQGEGEDREPPEKPGGTVPSAPHGHGNGHGQTSPAGAVGMALKRAGLDPTRFSLSDPRLLELLRQGATLEEFESAAREAAKRKQLRDPFAWLLTVVQQRREEAAAIRLAPAEQPDPMAWAETRGGVINRANALGIGPWNEVDASNRQGPTWQQYRQRVINADAAQRQGAPA